MSDEQQEIEIEAIGIEVDSQPIELYKVLKLANAVSGGGEAKYAIAEGYVAVNGELDTRKRRKLYDGDLVEFNQEYYLIICDAPVSEPLEAKPIEKASTHKKAPSTRNKADKGRNAAKSAGKKSTNKTPPSNKAGDKANHSSTETPPENKSGRGAIRFF